MSTLDQPILIANSNYHVGHQVAIFVAEDRGFFREEGLKEYEYDSRGLIPGPIEREGLGAAIKNHGVDIATAVDVEAAIYQRSLGVDVYIDENSHLMADVVFAVGDQIAVDRDCS